MGNHWSEKIRRYLQSPYPVVYQRWKVVLISSLVVFLILLVLQPFGISGIEGHKFWILLGFMGVTAVFLGIPVYLFACLFPEFYKEEGWTVWKQIVNLLMVILFIAVGNWLYSTFVFGWGLRWDVFCVFALFTLVIGLFPTVLFILLNQNRLLAIHLEEATEMNLHLQRSVSATESIETTEIVSLLSFQGGTRESLELDSKDLLYIESDGNYIRVNYQKGGRTMQCLLRMTMKQAEEVTGGSPLVAKCHRAFLVNLRKVVKVSGNSQGYRLLLEGCPEEIPVSRAYSKQVKELMETIVGK
ncbi:LytTR family transcriptional regulator [Bacteroides fragilis]|uniref:LytTR family DNA-binding domain-containing protein n=1 Tax=Bacteroides TaxID=816 RepID=UPI0018972E66|nr:MULTISPECIES: LytTR family DNA-binding domain-containing protein [Bacteroides]MCE8623897.1 LytTR family transcriptional regulator [Bacteroides fragilis]MCE8698900.1 LytTR family transcriptional regulator [Bacteroides fragilis]MCE8704128.1 LytTR family transcriptional regulator [Bacteroides fragilis]MCE9325795.1 LytTR family transcriptional regulator [Bacteroides fragilis]MCE9446578.1 LytTR family transcriptional regulator [Bacteroides fragilis]